MTYSFSKNFCFKSVTSFVNDLSVFSIFNSDINSVTFHQIKKMINKIQIQLSPRKLVIPSPFWTRKESMTNITNIQIITLAQSLVLGTFINLFLKKIKEIKLTKREKEKSPSEQRKNSYPIERAILFVNRASIISKNAATWTEAAALLPTTFRPKVTKSLLISSIANPAIMSTIT